MTWKEFKDAIEARGIADDWTVHYIDTDHFDDDDEEYPGIAFDVVTMAERKAFYIRCTPKD